MASTPAVRHNFPVSAGILLGVGLGGFFDGIAAQARAAARPGRWRHSMMARMANAGIWFAFAAGVILATAPVWRLWVFGFNPTLDEMLRIVCKSN